MGFLSDTGSGLRQTVATMEPPETRYVSVGDAEVAYQVIGEGPRDILFCNALGGHVDLLWQLRPSAEFLTELSALGACSTWTVGAVERLTPSLWAPYQPGKRWLRT